MEFGFEGLILCFILLCYSALKQIWKLPSYSNNSALLPTPPGPKNIRLIGTTKMITWKDRFQVLSQLRTKYGNIFSVSFGNTKIVVLNDSRMVKEAFIDCEFSGKPVGSHWIENNSIKDEGGIGYGNEEWSESRNFLIKTMSNLGFGTKSMESYFMEEAREMVDDFRKIAGKTAIFPHDRFRVAGVNPVWLLATGKKWTVDSPEFLKLKTFIIEVSKSCKIFLKGYAFPWLTKFYCNDYKTYLNNKSKIRKHLKAIIACKRRNSKSDGHEDLIDLYQKKIAETTDSKSCFYREMGESTMLFALEDLLLGGTEAVSTALLWILIFLVKYPDVQENVFNEIQKIIEQNQQCLTLADRQLLPYTEAVIMEAMRFSGLNPLTHHKTNTDVNFRGYRIPKGTTILANFTEIFKDPLVWGDPENFRPERFLSVDLKSVIQHEAFLMFSVGKRVCPAKHFSRDQIFIYLTSLCQNFKFSRDRNSSHSTDPTLNTYAGVFRYPRDASLIFMNRQSKITPRNSRNPNGSRKSVSQVIQS